jgi:hypothetical protein
LIDLLVTTYRSEKCCFLSVLRYYFAISKALQIALKAKAVLTAYNSVAKCKGLLGF